MAKHNRFFFFKIDHKILFIKMKRNAIKVLLNTVFQNNKI